MARAIGGHDMRRYSPWLLAALLWPLLSVPAMADPQACVIPEDLALTDPSLPAVHAVLAAHQPLTILAIGGTSTAGLAAQGAAYTYPARLEALLRAQLPGVAITVINRGMPGNATRARVDALGAELTEVKPTLVIWAPGSSEAGQSEDIGPFVDTLNEGVELIRAAHADLMLIDLQYTPSIARIIDLSRYNGAIAGVAQAEQIPLLHRTDLMRRWSDSGEIDLEMTGRKLWTASIRHLFDCLATALATAIVTATP
jgi:hypothetical protein